MKRGNLGFILGLGASLASGCSTIEKAPYGTIWERADPRNFTCLVDRNGSEQIERSRIFFSYYDDKGERHCLEFFERKKEGENKWELTGISGIENDYLFNILSERLPRLAQTIKEKKISLDDIILEDAYDTRGVRTGTKIYLPSGHIEEYPIETPKSDLMNINVGF